MKQLIYFLLLSAFVSMITGCSNSNFFSFPGVYKMDIQQGNVLAEKKIRQLKTGMTKEQVAFIMGNPVLTDIFNENRWDYVYSFQPGGEPRQQKRLTLFFQQNQLIRMTGDALPQQRHKVKNENSSTKPEKCSIVRL